MTGVLALSMGLYAAVFSGPSQAAGPDDRAAAADCCSCRKPRPVWHGSKSLKVTPKDPIPSERVRLRGKVAKPVPRGATVLVQVKKSGKSWQTVDKDKSISKPRHVDGPLPGTPEGGRSLGAGPGARLPLPRGVHQQAAAPAGDEAPDPADSPRVRIRRRAWEATIAISPARPGARVTLLARLEPGSGANVSSRDALSDWLEIGTGISRRLPASRSCRCRFRRSASVPRPVRVQQLPADALFAANASGYNGIPPYEGDIGTPEDYGLEGEIPPDPTPTPDADPDR